MRLNNFVAPGAAVHRAQTTSNPAGKFSSTNKRKPTSDEDEEDAYDDDFESLSKSQVAVSIAKMK